MVTTEGGLSLEAGVTDINIDLTNPTVTYAGGKASYQVDEQVSITCTAEDALSGVAATTCANVSGPAYSFGVGSHTFSASATDRAGNTGSGSVTFTVGVTYTSLCNLSQRFADSRGVGTALCALLRLAEAADAHNNSIVKKLSLQAYVLLVRAQTGKTLTATEAATLIASRGACNPMTSHEGDSGHMKRRLVALAAVALAIVAVPSALADPPAKPTKQKLTQIKLLAFNDFHGHLEAGTPGTIVNPATGLAVPSGGAEYFATHMKALGSENVDTYVVSAGDLIGASPLASGLMHDEPTIDVMNYIGLDTIGVGNHEFDEGKGELLRMQYGNQTHEGGGANTGTAYTPLRPDGCHPVDGCQDGTPFAGSVFQYLAANVTDTDTDNPLLPAYQIVNTSEGEKIAFVGETLQGTPLIVTPTGVAGLSFLDEADTINALVPRLKQRQVSTIVLLLHEGGTQNAPFSRGFMDVNKCENFTGPDLLDIVNRLDPAVDLVVSAHTHQPYVCRFNDRLVTSAASFGRLITSIDVTIDRRAGKMVDATAENHVVTQTVRRMRAQRRSSRGTRRSPTRSGTASSAGSRRTSTRRAARSTGPTPPVSSRWAT